MESQNTLSWKSSLDITQSYASCSWLDHISHGSVFSGIEHLPPLWAICHFFSLEIFFPYIYSKSNLFQYCSLSCEMFAKVLFLDSTVHNNLFYFCWIWGWIQLIQSTICSSPPCSSLCSLSSGIRCIKMQKTVKAEQEAHPGTGYLWV